jgi:hypothetical protein
MRQEGTAALPAARRPSVQATFFYAANEFVRDESDDV